MKIFSRPIFIFLGLSLTAFCGNSFADSTAQEVCPVELRELINDSTGTCEETYPIARPFLEEAAQERLDKSNQFMGDLLIKSIKNDLNSIGSLDQIYFNLGLDFGSVDSCDLSKIKEDLPCAGSEQTNLKALTAHLPGGGLESIDDLVGLISNQYKDNVLQSRSMDSKSCMSSAWDGSIALQKAFMGDYDLKKLWLFAKNQIEDLSQEDKEKYEVLAHEFKNIFPSFYKNLVDLDPATIVGSSLQEQLASFLGNEDNKETFHNSMSASCSKMKSRISSIVCSPLDNGAINNREFNLGALDYDPDFFVAGYDEFEVEMAGLDPKTAYSNYILSCSPICESCEESISVDKLIEDNFGGDILDDLNIFHDAENVVKNRRNNENFCPLLTCENALEVFQGAACEEREVWRTPSEISEVLNCPGDEMCNEDSFKSFTQALSIQQQTSAPQQAGVETPVAARPQMSSFSRSFLGVSDTVEQASGTPSTIAAQENVGVEQIQTASNRLLPDSDFEEVRQRIDQADSRLAVQSSGHSQNRRRPRRNSIPQAFSNQQGAGLSAARRSRRSTRDLYQGDSTEQASYGDVLDSLIDVVKGQGENDRLRKEIMDGSLQEIARSNEDVLSRLNNADQREADAYQEGLNRGRRNNRRRAYQDNYESTSNTEDQNPLVAEIPDSLSGEEGSADSSGSGVQAGRAARGSTSGGGGAVAAAGSGSGSARAPGAAASDTQAAEGESEETDLPQYEINQQALRILDATLLRSNLRRRGIKPDKPFVMLVNDGRGESVKLPVKPLTYLGQTIFVPVIMGENAGIVGIVEQSPLFAGYRSYLGGQ